MTPADDPPPIDGSGTSRARCVLAPNPGPMTLNGTNTWLIAEPGSPSALVVDPGPDDEDHLRRVVDLLAGAGQQTAQILLTHGHSDHSAGAARLASLTGAPVLAADPAFRLGETGLGPGDVLAAAGCEVRVVATPGHTAEDGSLADYLGSLDRLRALADEARLRVLLPGHGPLLTDPAGALDFYIAHRRERLAEVSAALAAGDRTPAEIVARVYVDVDRGLWPFAEWSVRAQLAYLADEGALPPGMSN